MQLLSCPQLCSQMLFNLYTCSPEAQRKQAPLLIPYRRMNYKGKGQRVAKHTPCWYQMCPE